MVLINTLATSLGAIGGVASLIIGTIALVRTFM
jgi:hypothetical protein